MDDSFQLLSAAGILLLYLYPMMHWGFSVGDSSQGTPFTTISCVIDVIIVMNIWSEYFSFRYVTKLCLYFLALSWRCCYCTKKHRNKLNWTFQEGFDDKDKTINQVSSATGMIQNSVRVRLCHIKACHLTHTTIQAQKRPPTFLQFTFCLYPFPMKWLAALVKSVTQSPITWKGCEVYESDYRPIFPEIRTLSPGSSGPHRASQAWPQTREVFSLLSLLVVVKRPLCKWAK